MANQDKHVSSQNYCTTFTLVGMHVNEVKQMPHLILFYQLNDYVQAVLQNENSH